MKINILFYISLGIFLVSISLILLTVQNKDGFENTNTKSEIIELDKLLEKFSEQKLKIKMAHFLLANNYFLKIRSSRANRVS